MYVSTLESIERLNILLETSVKDAARPFVSHCARGKAEHLVFSCQVVGTDPTHGFPRICDQTASIRVFEGNPSSRYRRQFATMITVPEEELSKKLVEIRAKCFNVTLAVQIHTERCPWCPNPSKVTVIRQRLPEDVPSAGPTSVSMDLLGNDNVMSLSMMVLAGIAVLSSIGIACVLIAFLRLRRADHQISLKSDVQPRSQPKLVKIPIRDNAQWEQTGPLTYTLAVFFIEI